MLSQRWMLKNAKYKNLGENLYINFFLLYKFSPRVLYFAFLNIHRWLNITNITPHGPDDGSVEPKRYSVDFSINLSFHFDYLTNFSLHIVGLQSII